MMYVVYIIFSIVVLIIRQVVLAKVVKFDNWRLIRGSYFPCIFVAILACLGIFIQITPIVDILIQEIYLLVLFCCFILTKQERQFCLDWMKNKLLS